MFTANANVVVHRGETACLTAGGFFAEHGVGSLRPKSPGCVNLLL